MRKKRRTNQVETKVKPKPRMDVKHVDSQTTRQAQDNSQLKIPTSTDPGLPAHMVLEKGPNLREIAKEMAGRKDKLDEEFKLIADYTRINVKKDSKRDQRDKQVRVTSKI